MGRRIVFPQSLLSPPTCPAVSGQSAAPVRLPGEVIGRRGFGLTALTALPHLSGLKHPKNIAGSGRAEKADLVNLVTWPNVG